MYKNIGERLRYIRQIKGLRAEDLSQLTGIAASTIYNWETRNSSIPVDLAIKIAESLGISVKWLAFGTGSIEPEEEENGETIESRQVPIIATVHAGYPCEAVEDIIRYDILPLNRESRQIECGVIVAGDSMESTLSDGDTLYISSKVDTAVLPNRSLVIARIGNETVIRRYMRTDKGFVLLADNHDYSPISASETEIQVVARVLSYLHLCSPNTQ